VAFGGVARLVSTNVYDRSPTAYGAWCRCAVFAAALAGETMSAVLANAATKGARNHRAGR
jgi:hypothetical protein